VEREVTGQAGEPLFPAPGDGGAAAVLLQLADLGSRVGALEDLLTAEPDRAGYTPIPAPKWWLLTGDARAEAIGRLAAWVDEVYRPSYGHLAARLPACWPEHPLCLYCLDWLCELHSVLYLRARRSPATLAGQAEWTIRQLPAATDLMAAEARGCEHSRLRVNGAVR
jgi:hypothetical protein